MRSRVSGSSGIPEDGKEREQMSGGVDDTEGAGGARTGRDAGADVWPGAGPASVPGVEAGGGSGVGTEAEAGRDAGADVWPGAGPASVSGVEAGGGSGVGTEAEAGRDAGADVWPGAGPASVSGVEAGGGSGVGTEAEAGRDAGADVWPGAGPASVSGVEAGGGSGVGTEAEAGRDAGADVWPGAGPASVPGVEAGGGSGVGTEAEAGRDAGADVWPGAGPASVPGVEAGGGSGVGTEAEAGRDAGADVWPGAGPASVPGVEAGGGSGVGTEAEAGRDAGADVWPGAGPASVPGVEAGGGSGVGTEAEAGSDAVLDLVLDLAPGDAADPAFGVAPVSVPAAASAPALDPDSDPLTRPLLDALSDTTPLARTEPGPDAPHGTPPPTEPGPASAAEAIPVPESGSPPVPVSEPDDAVTGRRPVAIAKERAASIPVHLLFRGASEYTDAVALPSGLAKGAGGGDKPAGRRRAPVAHGAQVKAPTRPAPVGDPRLTEKPGPALPGWAAVLAGLAGIAGGGAVLWWVGALPAGVLARLGIGSRPYDGIGTGAWVALAALVTVVFFALGGLTRGRVGHAWVMTLFGDYRGSVRRTGLVWVSPLLLRRRVDVRLRHWRSEPLPAVDANGTALRVVVLVVWRIKDTARATLGVADHEEYLCAQVEAAMARVLSQLPTDAFHEDAHTLRDAEAVGDALTGMLKADCEPVGIEVYSAQPTGIEYAPELAAAMQRRRIAAIDAQHRDSVLTSVIDAVDDTVNRLTTRGLVELDHYERNALVKDLTVAFCTGHSGAGGA
ncbi:SPFH domain-containing protein [Streptomyces sp. NBC_00873]|uniref:SPFH domain-containing protein n=1 Tax=Streptomyces sp. NBC_00873 TaxID=2975852 RepID=UPI00386B7DDA|nr:SPFH domain-containing protein [Streptomyces sp. NBC_00873]